MLCFKGSKAQIDNSGCHQDQGGCRDQVSTQNSGYGRTNGETQGKIVVDVVFSCQKIPSYSSISLNPCYIGLVISRAGMTRLLKKRMQSLMRRKKERWRLFPR